MTEQEFLAATELRNFEGKTLEMLRMVLVKGMSQSSAALTHAVSQAYVSKTLQRFRVGSERNATAQALSASVSAWLACSTVKDGRTRVLPSEMVEAYMRWPLALPVTARQIALVMGRILVAERQIVDGRMVYEGRRPMSAAPSSAERQMDGEI